MACSRLRGGESADVLKFNAVVAVGFEKGKRQSAGVCYVGQSKAALLPSWRPGVEQRGPGSRRRLRCSFVDQLQGPLEARLHTIGSV